VVETFETWSPDEPGFSVERFTVIVVLTAFSYSCFIAYYWMFIIIIIIVVVIYSLLQS